MKTNEFNALSEMIKISNRALLAKSDADMSVLNYSIRDLTSEMKKHNGRLSVLEERQKDSEKTIGILKWMRKKWVLIAFIGIVIFYGLLTLYETGLFIDLIRFMGGKI
jgi:hypothetical protein